MILIGVIITGIVWIIHLTRKCKQLSNESKPTPWTLTHSKDLLLSVNETLYRLESSLDDDKSRNITRTSIQYNELFNQLKLIINDYDDDMSKNSVMFE